MQTPNEPDSDMNKYLVEVYECDGEASPLDLTAIDGIIANLIIRSWSKIEQNSLDFPGESSPYVTHEGDQDGS